MKKCLFAATVAFVITASASPFKDLPGSIPRAYEDQAASDLVYQGKLLIPDDARALYESGKIKDLSLIDPDGTSDLWSKLYPPQPNDPTFSWSSRISAPRQDDWKQLGLAPSGEVLEFVSQQFSPVGTLHLIAQKKQPNGAIRTYQLIFDLKGHNMLLRKELLRKIGYKVRPMENLRQVTLKFKGAFSKKEFLTQLDRATSELTSRWQEGSVSENSETATFRDLIVIDGANDREYNLARGDMDPKLIRGRRLLNALLIPFAMSDSPESLNLMSWGCGMIENNRILMPYESARAFSPSFEDARWISRLILRQSPQDWSEIARATGLPREAQLLITEKLKARRNCLISFFKFEDEFTEIPFNLKISDGPNLVNGELVKAERTWDGYARYMVGFDSESPLSGTELVSLFKSKSMTQAITSAVGEFNARILPRTDLGFKIFDHKLDVSAKQFANFIVTKKAKRLPVSVWKTPFFNTDLIFNREIVAGHYLGAENRVQLADTVGFAVDTGAFFLWDNLPTPMSASASIRAFYVKTYTRLKPVVSIKKSLSEPLKDIIVPLVASHAASPLDKIIELEKQRNILSEEELTKKLTELLGEFKKIIGVGESLLISGSWGPELRLDIGRSMSEHVQAYARMQEKLVSFSRTQIFHPAENRIQIYMDPATANVFSFGVGLRNYIPVLELGYKSQIGIADTHYFDYDLNPDVGKNKTFFESIQAVRAALRGTSVEYLSSKQRPFIIHHDFRDSAVSFDFLMFKFVSKNTANNMLVTSPTGEQTKMHLYWLGDRQGIDYDGLLTNITKYLISEKLGADIKVAESASSSPADTIGGSSVVRSAGVELRAFPHAIDWNQIVSFLGYSWRGWKLSKTNLDRIIQGISSQFNRTIFPKHDLHNTENIQFYSVEVKMWLYKAALLKILSLTDAEVTHAFQYYQKKKLSGHQVSKVSSWQTAVIQDLGSLRKAVRNIDYPKIAKIYSEILEVVETQLEFEGFKLLVGGEQNILVNGVVRGFRSGPENGDQDYLPYTLGEPPPNLDNDDDADLLRGPIKKFQKDSGISTGELFLTWILNPL